MSSRNLYFVLVLTLLSALSLVLSRPASEKRAVEVNPEEGNWFEGDIRFRDGFDPMNGLVDTQYRWPDAVVYYQLSTDFNDTEVEIIHKAIAEYHNKTCIKWVAKTEEAKDFVDFQNEESGCWSYVGRQGGAQTLNLQDACFKRYGTVVHEMMHAAGFYHEQSRTERDDFVEIVWENIIEGYEHNFDKYGADEIDPFDVPYDYGSVMHYPELAFSNNGEPTIVPREPNVTIGQRIEMSVSDQLKLNRMYECAIH